jgi:hypothetical protein
MVRAWDVFVSHASEDKDEVAIPLAQVLRRAGLRVWLDRQELRIGDSLHEKIDEGLANSRYGIVIVSPSFLDKRFPRKELDGLFAREDAAGHNLILPIWHQLDKAAVARYSPILADRLAGNTADGIPSVAAQIIEVVTSPGNEEFPDVAPTPLRLLVELLDRNPVRSEVIDFLASYPGLVHQALGTEPRSELWSTEVGSVTIDLRASRYQPTAGSLEWTFVQFQPPAEPLFVRSAPSPSLNGRVSELQRAMAAGGDWVHGFVVAGRRQHLSQDEVEGLRRYNHNPSRLSVRTYDWLIDIAAEQAWPREDGARSAQEPLPPSGPLPTDPLPPGSFPPGPVPPGAHLPSSDTRRSRTPFWRRRRP